MTEYEQIKDFISKCPGSTRGMMEKEMPEFTHWNKLLKRLVSTGEGYRKRVISPDTGREGWGYFLGSEE